MLLLGFSVLAMLLCLNVPSGAIGTSDYDREQENVEKYGIHGNYCEKSRSETYSMWNLGRLDYPPTPINCWNRPEMRCKIYIKTGGTKFGLTVEDYSWPIRECACEHKLVDCLKKNMTSDDWIRARPMLYQEKCLWATGCTRKSMSGCTPRYRATSVRVSM